MARPKSTTPTDRELAILHVLWDRGSATIREVHDVLKAKSKVGYTSVQKIMQIMLEKTLIARDEASNPHIYHALKSRAETQQKITRNVLEKVFAGSAMHMVTAALGSSKLKKDELAQIRALLAEAEQKKTEADDA